MKLTLTFFLTLVTVFAAAQKQKVYFPAWTFQQKHTTIYGLSAGLWNFTDGPNHTVSNGLRLCLIGEGIMAAFVPRSPIPDNESEFASSAGPFTERINGISVSGTGIAGTYKINGISLGMVGHFTEKVNGLSASAINFSLQHRGIQVAIFLNECFSMNGMQIGAVNKSKRTRGIQVGLWNVNERRKLPLLNWNFRKKHC